MLEFLSFVPVEPAEAAAPGLRDAVCLPEVEATLLRHAVGLRLDRAGAMVQEHLATGGKRVRARLALCSTAALGGSRHAAIPWAAAVELLHNATLVHDDLQDGDRMRRGRPTLWARHGAPQAVNAGDLLLMLPYRAIEDLAVPDAVKWRLSRAVARAAEATVRGQATEMDLLASRRLDAASWEAAALGKTGALLGLPVEGAAILRGLGDATAAALSDAFARVGLVYQLADDVADCFGDKGRGERGSDLREGKVSVLVVAHLARHPEDAAWLLRILEAPRDLTDAGDVRDAIEAFRARGALDDVLARMERFAEEVLHDPVLAAVPDLRRLADELIAMLTGRDAAAGLGALRGHA